MTYKAFISYSHRDSASEARDIHQTLVRFATPWYRRRGMRLFLDDANLPASPALWQSIEIALQESEYFILLATPAAADSTWCQKEIQHWLEHKSSKTIILVLLSGSICWDSKSNDFDWPRTSSLPSALRGAFANEPHYVDLSRVDPAGRFRAVEAKNRLADVAAALLGRSKDELIGEDLRLHRRALRLAQGAVAILAITSILAVWQWHRATVQRDLAEQRLSQAIDISDRMLWDIDEKLSGVAGAGELRRDLTYDALAYLIELREQAAGDEDLDWAQISAYYQKGILALRYGDLKEAESDLAEAVQRSKAVAEKLPGFIEPYHSWALAEHAMGKVQAAQHQFSEAYDAFDRAKQLADFILEDTPGDEDTQLLLLNLYQDWGDAAYDNADIPVAHQNYAAGLELVESLVFQHPEDAEYLFIYTLLLDRKARYFPIHEDPESLLEVRELATDILDRLVDQFPEVAKYRLNLAVAYEKLGDIAFTIGNIEGAHAYYSHAVGKMQALYLAEPINNLYKHMLALDYGHLGKTLLEMGRSEDAFDMLEQQHAWMQTLVATDPDNANYQFDFILAERDLGDFHARSKNRSEAEEHLRSVIQSLAELLKEDAASRRANLLLAATRVELAEVLIDDPEESTKLIKATNDHLEGWLADHDDGEAWLYLAQARTNHYLITLRKGDGAGVEAARERAAEAIARMTENDRKKFAREVSILLEKLGI